MERTLTKQSLQKIGQEIMLQGWADTIRNHGKIIFIELRDRSGKVQVVADKNQIKVHPEDVIEIIGTITNRPENMINPNHPTGTIEVQAKEIKILAKSAELPFDISKESLDLELPTLLDYRSLTLRHPKVQAIFKVQQVVVDSFRQALKQKDFMEFQAPSIISAVPEGGAEVFKVNYFDRNAYLSQSPQLYKSLLVGAFERVFSVNQIFRAEPSVTTRHLTEATSLDAEFGFINDWQEVLEMQEYVVKFIFNAVQTKCADELALYNATLPTIPDKIPTLKLRQAQEIIFSRTGRDCREEKDLAPEDEREICTYAKEELGSDLIFITHFVTAKKPFYVAPDPEDPTYAYSVDLLGRGVEWSSGGERLHDYNQILENVKKWGLKPEDIELYLQSFRYGVPRLGGFALGAERMTMQILGLKNVREASLFPRDMERIDMRLSVISKPIVKKSNKSVFEQICNLLDDKKIEYKKFEHEPVFTSEEAAKIRGTKLEEGAKALVLIADNKPVMAVVSAVNKLDPKAFKKAYDFKDVAMADKDTLLKVTSLQPGAVPPFGSLFSIPTYVDENLTKLPSINFNAGSNTQSIQMNTKDFLSIEKAIVGQFSK